jgi:hypothetical protein
MGENIIEITEHSFPCDVCGKPAGTVKLLKHETYSSFEIKGFISEISGGIQYGQYEKFYTALKNNDPGTLFRMDFEYAPFYCPECNRCYCSDHWKYWIIYDEEEPSYFDYIKGICPKGHKRMLED